MRLLAVLFLTASAAAWTASDGAPPLRLTDVSVPHTVAVADGARAVLPVTARVYRGGIECVRAPCPQGPPVRLAFRLVVTLDRVASATVHAARTVRAHASHDIVIPLAVDLVGHPARGGARRLAGTVRLYVGGGPVAVDCRRFWIDVNARGTRRPARPPSESERRCPP